MRLAKIIAVAFLVPALVFGQVAGAAEQLKPVKVVLLYNGTGAMASIDEPSYKGSMLAAKLINSKGSIIDGRKLELIPIDTYSDMGKVISAASKEENKTDVAAAIGYGDSSFVISAASSFVHDGIPFITPGATLPTLFQMVGDRLFMVAYGDDAQAQAMADYTYNTLKIKKLAVWTDTSMAFTLALSDSFKKRYTESGGTIIYEDMFISGMPTPPDFSHMAGKLTANEPKPDAVFISAVPEEAALAVKKLRNSGINIPILSGDGFDSQLVIKAATAKPITDVYFTTHSYRGDNRPEVASFINAYKKEYGIVPEDAFAALGYDAVNVLADAIKRAGSADKAAIAKALSQTKDFKAVTGTITMRQNMPPLKSIAIIEIKDGTYVVKDTWDPIKAIRSQQKAVPFDY